MLNATLEKTMAKAKNYENLTKASKYSTLYKVNDKKNDLQDMQMYKKIQKYVKKNAPVSDIMNEDISDYIVEDPSRVRVEIDFSSNNLGIPFFKALQVKLSKI